MPTVPKVESPQEQLIGMPETRVSQPQGKFGTQLLDVAETGLEITGRAQEIAAREQERIDKAMVLDADYRLSTLKTNLEVQRNQYKGRDSAAALEAIKKEWETGAEEISQTLGNDAQKAAYLNRVQHHWAGAGGLYESTLKYTDKEIAKFENDTFNSVADLRIRNAINNSSNPEVFEQSLEELKAITKDFYKDNPALAEKTFNDYVDEIKTGVKELNIEAERQKKRLAEEAQLEANNDLSDLLFADALSYEEIKRRELALGNDYERWVKAYKKSQEAKEKEAKTGKKPEDDPEISAELAVEAMTMPADVTSADITAFREKVGKQVLAGKLKPETGRAIISDAERTLSLDPARKASESDVVVFFKNDYNDGVYGEPGTPEARAEYIRQLDAFRKWSRNNLDKEPVEYFERVSDTNRKGFISRLFNIGAPEVTPEQRRVEIEREDKRNKAIEALKKQGRPTTEANIEYVMGYM